MNKNNYFSETDCNICFHTFFEHNNPVVYCSRCKISVHKLCYGIEKIPENDYYCEVCEMQIKDKKNKVVSCFLCKKEDLPMKKIEKQWYHIQCLIMMNLGMNFKVSLNWRKLLQIKGWNANECANASKLVGEPELAV